MANSDPWIGKQVGNYRIVEIINSGAFGSVYKGKHLYFVTMYAAGSSLRDRLGKRHGQPVPIDEPVVILTQVGQALQYAHQRQPSVVHRDLKPENILSDEKSHALLADFGIAVLLSSVRTGLVGSSGTPPYMAPLELSHSLDSV